MTAKPGHLQTAGANVHLDKDIGKWIAKTPGPNGRLIGKYKTQTAALNAFWSYVNKHPSGGTGATGPQKPIGINEDDRSISAETAERIDRACALTYPQRRLLSAMSELRSAIEDLNAPELRLGQNVQHFRPEERTTKPKPKHAHVTALAQALKSQSVPQAQAALTNIMTTAAPPEYDEPDTDEGDGSGGGSAWQRVGDTLAAAAPWAAALVAWIAEPDQVNQDPTSVAERTASDATVQVQSSAALDQIEQQGGNQWKFVAEDNACKVCEALDGQVFDLDDDSNAPPEPHSSCGCSIEPVNEGTQ